MIVFNQGIWTPYGLFEILASDQYLVEIRRRQSVAISNPNKITMVVERQLRQYFAGQLAIFDVPINFTNTFSGRVYQQLMEIGLGETISYQKLGILAGSNAAQAVGTAMAKNKIPLIIPCHRVIKSTGELGQYALGVEMKQKLLTFESENSLSLNLFPQKDNVTY